MNPLPKKYKFLKVLNKILGFVCIGISAWTLTAYFLVLLIEQRSISFDLNIYYNFMFFFVPGLFLLKSSKLISSFNYSDALKSINVASLVLIILIAFVVIGYVVQTRGNEFDFFELWMCIVISFYNLIYPIFFFIFKKKLPEVNSESMENGLLESEEIL
jgi:hypothetical protein